MSVEVVPPLPSPLKKIVERVHNLVFHDEWIAIRQIDEDTRLPYPSRNNHYTL